MPDIRRIYNPQEFVGREGELRQALEWANTGRGSIYFIFGSPGVGKSWFLRRFGDALLHSVKHPHVCYLDVQEWVDNPLQPVGQNVIVPEKMDGWLQMYIPEQLAVGLKLRQYDPDVQLELSLTNLAIDLDRHFQDREVYVFIDNGDLVQRGSWHDWVERKVITPFLNVNGSKFRFVVALRDDKQNQLPSHEIKYSNQCWLTPWPTSETGRAQLQRLLDGQEHLTLNDVIGILPGYDLTHACLTLLLFQLANEQLLAEPPIGIDYASLVIRGLNALNPLPPDEAQQQKIIDTVRWIARELKDEPWGSGEFADRRGISQSDAADKDGPIRLLQKQWLLVNDGRDSTYRLPGGLGSFVRACDAG